MKLEDLKYAIKDFFIKVILPNYGFLEGVVASIAFSGKLNGYDDKATEFLTANGIMDENGLIDKELLSNIIFTYKFQNKDTETMKLGDKEFYIRKDHIGQILHTAEMKSMEVSA